MIDFSFIIPVYNVEKYIGQCIESVLNQTYNNFEIILIDDGSTDNSGRICDEYAKKDSRIKVFHSKNEGVSSARNKGIELAIGEYIIFLDSDDYWISDKLNTIYKKCSENKLDLLVFNYEIYDEKDEKVIVPCGVDLRNTLNKIMNGEQYLEQILELNTLYGWYAWYYAIKREIIKKYDFKFISDIKYEDVDLIYKIILQSNKISVLDEIILRYRVSRQGSITQNVKLNTEKDKLSVIRCNIENIQNLSISSNTKRLLCNNFSCLYYSTLILYNDISDSNEKKELLKDLRNSVWVCKYTTSTSQKFIYNLMKIIGIKPICRILNIRRKIKSKV